MRNFKPIELGVKGHILLSAIYVQNRSFYIYIYIIKYYNMITTLTYTEKGRDVRMFLRKRSTATNRTRCIRYGTLYNYSEKIILRLIIFFFFKFSEGLNRRWQLDEEKKSRFILVAISYQVFHSEPLAHIRSTMTRPCIMLFTIYMELQKDNLNLISDRYFKTFIHTIAYLSK